MHCKIKKDNHHGPKIVRYPGIKKRPRKKNLQIIKNRKVTITTNTTDTKSADT